MYPQLTLFIQSFHINILFFFCLPCCREKSMCSLQTQITWVLLLTWVSLCKLASLLTLQVFWLTKSHFAIYLTVNRDIEPFDPQAEWILYGGMWFPDVWWRFITWSWLIRKYYNLISGHPENFGWCKRWHTDLIRRKGSGKLVLCYQINNFVLIWCSTLQILYA